MKNLVDIDLAGKRVGIRVDLNVPIDNGTILNSERLSAALPSILHILKHTDNLCIITHLGRPKEGNYDEQFSIKPIVEWFKKRLNRDIQLCTDFKSLPGSLCFIENIRFFDGETKNSDMLADEIAKSFDIYVMDAFATAHRKAASTYGAIKKSTLACAGILFQNEVENISSALVEGSSLSSIVGGSKVSTKLEVISNLLNKSEKVLVGGGIANTFLKAAGNEIGRSLCEDDMLGIANQMLGTGKIVLPRKVMVADSTSDESVEVVSFDSVPQNKMILDIEFNEEVFSKNVSEIILWNGPLGIFEIDAFSKGTDSLVSYLSKSNSKVIAGGGETIFAITKFSSIDKFDYVSTAGGAFLEFLGGRELPSIQALN